MGVWCMKDALFGRPQRRRRRFWLPGVLALWLIAPLALAGADAALRSRYAAGNGEQTYNGNT